MARSAPPNHPSRRISHAATRSSVPAASRLNANSMKNTRDHRCWNPSSTVSDRCADAGPTDADADPAETPAEDTEDTAPQSRATPETKR